MQTAAMTQQQPGPADQHANHPRASASQPASQATTDTDQLLGSSAPRPSPKHEQASTLPPTPCRVSSLPCPARRAAAPPKLHRSILSAGAACTLPPVPYHTRCTCWERACAPLQCGTVPRAPPHCTARSRPRLRALSVPSTLLRPQHTPSRMGCCSPHGAPLPPFVPPSPQLPLPSAPLPACTAPSSHLLGSCTPPSCLPRC